MSQEKVVGRFEMLWDCAFCGKTRLLAITHRHCPECGAPQDQTKRYFPTDAEKVAVADDYAGADKACPACKHPNGAKATFCAQCGSPLDEAAQVKRRAVQMVGAGQSFAADDVKQAEAELGENAKPRPAAVKKSSKTWLYILIVVAMAIFAIWFLCIRKRTATLEVTEARWTRSIPIEVWQENAKEDWQKDLPSAARTLDCHDKQYETRQVEDGQTCDMKRVDKGDGTFEERQECRPKYRSEPVMKRWCRYMIFEWTKVDEKVASTTDGSEPPWPQTGLAAQVQQAPGAKREGARKEAFVLDVREPKGKSASCEVSQALWKQTKKGASMKGEVRARSGEIVCDTLRVK